MRYASLGIANIEILQTDRAWTSIFEPASAVTNAGRARIFTVHAKRTTGTRHLRQDLQSICLETELMTPRQDSAKNQQHLRNNPKDGRI